MEYRQLGRSGLRVSVVALGTMTFGGGGKFAKTGSTDVAGATRQIDLCLDAGVNLVDTADVYSDGRVGGDPRRGARAAGATTCSSRPRPASPWATGPTTRALSRHHLIAACEASLRRLRTDCIDLYQVHEWDGLTPLEETLEALDLLVRSGKVRYVGCSNFSGWHLMKALGISERRDLPALRLPADLLLAAGARRRVRARPHRPRPGPRHPRLEPARGRPADAANTGVTGRARRAPAQLHGLERAARARRGGLYDIVEALVEVAEARDAVPARRLRWPSCSAAPG